MLNLSSIVIGTSQPKEMGEFYQKVVNVEPTMSDGDSKGWMVGNTFLGIMRHSEVNGMAKEPGRIMFNLDTDDVKGEFERIKSAGATVVKEPYEMGNDMWIATFADLDGNYFQLMTPWKES